MNTEWIDNSFKKTGGHFVWCSDSSLSSINLYLAEIEFESGSMNILWMDINLKKNEKNKQIKYCKFLITVSAHDI